MEIMSVWPMVAPCGIDNGQFAIAGDVACDFARTCMVRGRRRWWDCERARMLANPLLEWRQLLSAHQGRGIAAVDDDVHEGPGNSQEKSGGGKINDDGDDNGVQLLLGFLY